MKLHVARLAQFILLAFCFSLVFLSAAHAQVPISWVVGTATLIPRHDSQNFSAASGGVADVDGNFSQDASNGRNFGPWNAIVNSSSGFASSHGQATASVVGGEGFFGLLPTLNSTGIASILAVSPYHAEASYSYVPVGSVTYDVDLINYADGKGPGDVDMCVLTNIVTYYGSEDPFQTLVYNARVGGNAGSVWWDGGSWDGAGGVFSARPGQPPIDQIELITIEDSYGGTIFFCVSVDCSGSTTPFFNADVGDVVIGNMRKSSYLATGVASKIEAVDIPDYGVGN